MLKSFTYLKILINITGLGDHIMLEKSLKNKTALITGASRLQGIGAAVARKSAEKELKLCLILNCSI